MNQKVYVGTDNTANIHRFNFGGTSAGAPLVLTNGVSLARRRG